MKGRIGILAGALAMVGLLLLGRPGNANNENNRRNFTKLKRFQHWLLYRSHSGLLRFFSGKERNAIFRIPILYVLSRTYRIDHSDLDLPINKYASFHALFRRPLAPESRWIEDISATGMVSPVDGDIKAGGVIRNNQLAYVKGSPCDVSKLLNLDEKLPVPPKDRNWYYSSIYLSPRDYHRIHSPCDMKLESVIYQPGELLPVHPFFVRFVWNLFARNERVIWKGTWAGGKDDKGNLIQMPIYMVAIAATQVGKILVHDWKELQSIIEKKSKNKEAWWKMDQIARTVTPPRIIRKGVETGSFDLGSTVVLVFQANGNFRMKARKSSRIRVGQTLGNSLPIETSKKKVYITSLRDDN